MNPTPKHGDYNGHTHVTTRTATFCSSSTQSRARWCAKCQDWTYATSLVGLVMSTVACPKCKTDWKDEHYAR